MTASRPLDGKDLEILRLLQDDAWITHTALGEAVHLSASAVQRRVRRLREERVITGARATVDASKTGHGLRVYLLLELHNDCAESLEVLEKELAAYPEVARVDLLSGKFDIIVVLDCIDMESFTDIAMTAINRNSNVRHCWTLMRLRALSNRA
ncbi:MAG: Lrp/AsnC family transcriptional regulator [Woeseiaceae bacterium]|nr:Lrp/AsnC family transcriptional regulator [Woeseiaceae bacterium]